MKKIIVILLSLVFFSAAFTGCSSASTGNVGDINDETTAVLEEAGFSEEEIAAMTEEERQAIADELGAVLEQEEQQKEEQESATEKVTPEDVENGGSYVVTVGDSMMWNYFELHYENGKLVKIVISFQKNDEEEPAVEIIEGDAIAEYTLFFIDYTMPASDLIDALVNQGYTNVYIEKN